MAKVLKSPWLERGRTANRHTRFNASVNGDYVIVGGGIAGLTTANFLLRDTRKQVVVLEAGRVAHGATGHNAGQLVSYFERPFHEMVAEFGLDMAVRGQAEVSAAWDLIADMRRSLRLSTPCLTFTGYAGIADRDTLISHLEDASLKRRAGIDTEQIAVAEQSLRLLSLPAKYANLYLVVDRQDIFDRLETKDKHYLGFIAGQKGCMNSAAFTQEVALALLAKYPKRFTVFEDSPVSQVELFKRAAKLKVREHTVTAKRVILCTNGFENFSLVNVGGSEIDTKFHHLVRGSIGYMAAFTEQPLEYPTAISYLPKKAVTASGTYDTAPYFYLTRRPYTASGKGAAKDLVCIGGPELLVDDTTVYAKAHVYPDQAHKAINKFVSKTYSHAGKKLSFKYFWHGLMGYTPNGIRCVGVEPCNPVLLYNLGCNGVGILPSVAGGLRIAQILKGQKMLPSMFDPADQRQRPVGKAYLWWGVGIGMALCLIAMGLAQSVIFW